jgi:hypothetical protein
MTEEQRVVLEAAIDLVNGGLDNRESVQCYAIISNYVLQNPPKTKEQ